MSFKLKNNFVSEHENNAEKHKTGIGWTALGKWSVRVTLWTGKTVLR